MKKSTQTTLSTLVGKLQNEADFDRFFTDVLTPQEYADMLDRIRICQQLLKGKTVLQVAKECNVASATVVRGNRVLKHGTGFLKPLLLRD